MKFIPLAIVAFILFFFVLEVEVYAAPNPCATARTTILHSMCQMYVLKKQLPLLHAR